jgi:hypothetical protein
LGQKQGFSGGPRQKLAAPIYAPPPGPGAVFCGALNGLVMRAPGPGPPPPHTCLQVQVTGLYIVVCVKGSDWFTALVVDWWIPPCSPGHDLHLMNFLKAEVGCTLCWQYMEWEPWFLVWQDDAALTISKRHLVTWFNSWDNYKECSVTCAHGSLSWPEGDLRNKKKKRNPSAWAAPQAQVFPSMPFQGAPTCLDPRNAESHVHMVPFIGQKDIHIHDGIVEYRFAK